MISNKSYYSIRSKVYAPACVAEVAEQGMNPLRLRGLHYYHSRILFDLLVHFSDGNVGRAAIFNMISFSYMDLFGGFKSNF